MNGFRGLSFTSLLPRVAVLACAGMNWQALFDSLDKDHNGSLDFDEVRGLMRRVLKIAPREATDGQLQLLFTKWDTDRSGLLSWEELQAAMAPPSPPPSPGSPASSVPASPPPSPLSQMFAAGANDNWLCWGDRALLSGLAPFLERFEAQVPAAEPAAEFAAEAAAIPPKAQCGQLLRSFGGQEAVVEFIGKMPFMPPKWHSCKSPEFKLWRLLTAALFLTFAPPLSTSGRSCLFLTLTEWRVMAREIIDSSTRGAAKGQGAWADLDQIYQQASIETRRRADEDPMDGLSDGMSASSAKPRRRGPSAQTPNSTPSRPPGQPLTPTNKDAAARRSPSQLSPTQQDLDERNTFVHWEDPRSTVNASPSAPNGTGTGTGCTSRTNAYFAREKTSRTAKAQRNPSRAPMNYFMCELALVGLARWMYSACPTDAQPPSSEEVLMQFVRERLLPTATTLHAKHSVMQTTAGRDADELEERRFAQLLESNRPALNVIFRHYVTPDGKRTDKLLSYKQTWRLARDFGIVPNYCNAKQLSSAFEAVTIKDLKHGQSAVMGNKAKNSLLSLDDFVDLTGIIALRHCAQHSRGSTEVLPPVERLIVLLSCMNYSDGLRKLFQNRPSAVSKAAKFNIPVPRD